MSVRKLNRTLLLIAGRVEQFYASKGIFLRCSTDSDVVLAALLRSGIQTSRAVSLLAIKGFGANALGVSRSMVDTWITVRWLTNTDTDARSRRFLSFNSKQRERIIDLIDKYYPGVDLSRFRGNEHHDLHALKYQRWDKWGPGTWNMAVEQELLEQEPSGPSSSKFAYDVPFFISSYYFHPTALGLHHLLPKAGKVLRFERSSYEDQLAEQALYFTAQFLLQIAFRIGRYWGIQIDDLVCSLWSRYIETIVNTEEKLPPV